MLLACPTAWAQPATELRTDLRQSGRIDLVSGQVVENMAVSNPNGPCIVARAGVRQVTIRRSRIGPCGPSGLDDYGVLLLEDVTDVRIEDNQIHDVGTGVKAYRSKGPLLVQRNLFYNIRGPLWNGQAVQFNGVTAGSASSRIHCNLSDADRGDGPKGFEDHFSLFDSHGSAQHPIIVSYNRTRGGSSKAGGGITVGDQGGSWIHVHHNLVLRAANSGIGVAGGQHIRVEDNVVDNRGRDAASLTHMAYFVRAFSACSDIVLRRNRGISRMWNWNERDGQLHPGYTHGPELCERVDDRDNRFGDESIAAELFDQVPEPCR